MEAALGKDVVVFTFLKGQDRSMRVCVSVASIESCEPPSVHFSHEQSANAASMATHICKMDVPAPLAISLQICPRCSNLFAIGNELTHDRRACRQSDGDE